MDFAGGVRGWRGFRLDLRIVSLFTLVVVVLVLGVLQYRWIDEVSETQEKRARARLREEVTRVADALDTEITRAVLVFTMPPAPDEAIDEKLDETWSTWSRDAPWPRVVSGLRLAEFQDAGWLTRAWGDAGEFDSRSIPDPDVRKQLRHGEPRGGGVVQASAQTMPLLVGGQPAMLSPLPVPGSPRMKWVVIRFDLSYLAGTFFSELLRQHATAEDRLDFRFQIGPAGPADPGTLFLADQFQFRPDCVTSHRAGGPTVSVSGFGEKTGRSGSPARRFSPRFETGDDVSLAALLHAAGGCQIPASRSSRGLMQVSVRRAAANAGDVFNDFRRRNTLLSGLVIVVLLAALTALVVSTERARRLARFQTVVAAGISHELRTPLATLSVAADHLKNGHVENSEQAYRYGEIVDAQTRRLRHVVDQALALSRPNQSIGESRRQAVSISETIHAACDGLAPRSREAGVQIDHQITPGMPPISANPELILRCLTNLIENAIKYAGSGGWIRVTARLAQRRGQSVVEVAVEDRGPGIPDDEASAVFEPFFRGSSARQSRQPGSGLGLAIVKSAVEAQGGWIALERAAPHGCKFRLFFPASDDRVAIHFEGPEEPRNAVAARITD